MSKWPYFADDEITAVIDVLKSGKVNYWTGQECIEFEKEFANYVGVKHAIALANGTLALELALLALGIGPGDEVIVPCRTFIATASCVVARGAKPVVADVDLNSQNITAETIRPLINSKTKAIIVVHLNGWPCEMDPILQLAKEHKLFVVEDCAQAHGATYKGKQVGSLGDIAAFSFCQDKIMTTGGEGGMVTTNSDEYWKKMWTYKDHGKSHDKVYSQSHPPGFRWLHDSFGTNMRMTEMQSAIGRLQLKKLTGWVNQRRANAAVLNEVLSDCVSIRVVKPKEYIGHAYYKYTCFVIPERLKPKWTRDKIMQEIVTAGVSCFTGGCPEIYKEVAFMEKGYGLSCSLPNAQRLGKTSLMFLVHPTLDENDIRQQADIIKRVIQQATI